MTTQIDAKSGDYITWRTWCGRTTAKVVSDHGLMCGDGFTDFMEQLPSGAEFATTEEIEKFERIRAGRVAPANYDYPSG